MSYIGVDLISSRRPNAVAVLDDRLRITTVEMLPLEAITEAVRSHKGAVCAINAPAGPNALLLRDKAYRQQIGLPPNRRSYTKLRVAEYELRRRGIRVRGTAPDADRAKRWVAAGWDLYAALREDGPRRLIETHAQAAFTVMLKRTPYNPQSLEGLLQRQLILYEEGVNVPNPMITLQEITRHRLLTGQMDFSDLYDLQPLNALVAAYTAYIVEKEPHNATQLGDPQEGLIHLPVSDLAEDYE